MTAGLSLRTRRTWPRLGLIGLGAALVYLLLPTQQYSGDGMRWYAIISGVEPLDLGGTNHLLYPALSRLYFYFANQLLGLPGTFALAQSLNACFGGAAIACFAYVLWLLTARWPIVIGTAAALAFSRAFSLHAADMTEPMPAIFLSLLALAGVTAFATGAQRSRVIVIAAGACVGLAAAIYQSSVLSIAVLASVLLLVDTHKALKTRVLDAAVCVISAGVAALGLYVAAFLLAGRAETLAQAVSLSLKTENELTQGVYAEFGLRRIGVMIFGFGDALFGLRAVGSQGALLFTYGSTVEIVGTVGIVAWSLTVVLLLAAPYVLRRLRLSSAGARLATAALVGLTPSLLLLVFWGARYSKLWIAPLILILIVVALLVAESYSAGGWLARMVRAVFWIGLVAPVVVAGLCFNLIADRLAPNPGMLDTQDVLTRVEPADLVVGDWGGTPYPLTGHAQSLGIIEAAFEAKLDSAAVGHRIAQEIEAARRRGGSVYFYDLLDLSETEWDVFLGQRIRLPHTLLANYRDRAQAVLTLRLKTPLGGPIHLWEMEP